MRRLSILAVALLAIGCSFRSVAPVLAPVSPQVVQKQPLSSPWLTTKLVRNSLPSQLAVGAKGYLWVADVGWSMITRVDMKLGAKNYPISFQPLAIVIGSDQNVWTSSYGVGTIARVTPSGAETDFSIGDPTAQIAQMVEGSDGAIWFSVSDNGGNAYIGRITTSGSFKLYPVAAAGSLTAGPDGNIWFVDATYLNKMNTQGHIIAQYPFTDYGDLTTIGPDGNMWFTAGDHLDRITTSGQITPFPAPNNGLYGITSWKDKLWMTDRQAQTDSLVSFDPITMTFSALVPSPHRLRRIIVGQDGNFWMTGLNAAIVTYVNQVLSVSPTSLTLQNGHSGTLSVAETNYDGMWKAQWIGSIVNVVQTAPGVFTVTGVGPGTTKVTIEDAMHNFTRIPVTVQ